MMTRVFVYGTLKRGYANSGWIRLQRFISEAETLPVYRMYDAGGYPALVLDEGGGVAIQGELWDVDAAGLARLDVLEGIAEGEYERVAAQLPPQYGEAEIYLWLGSTLGMPEIGSCWKE